MGSIFYWNSYSKTYKVLFWCLAVIFMALAASIVIIDLYGINSFIPWNVLSVDSSFPVQYTTFSLGPFSFSIDAEKKILTEFFSGGQIPSALLGSQLIMSGITLLMALFLAMVTMFRRMWYMVGMTGLLLFLILINVESVYLFGWSDTKALILVFILLLTPSYYLHAFSKGTGFLTRLWVMGFAEAILVALVYFFGETDNALLNLFSNGILAPFILLLIFILTVAHEILAGFINVISGSEGIADRTKLSHFLIISIIYLLNVLLSYLYMAHYIDWQLIYISPYLLVVVSAIIGIWGSRARAGLYVDASREEAVWPLLYLIIGIISLSLLGFIMITVNDAFLKVVENFIIYAHLGIGLAFLLYVLYNFIPLIEKGYATRNILYNPKNLPYLTYKLLGLLIILGLFAIRGFEFPVWYSIGGYNNAIADVQRDKGELEIADAFYKVGDVYAYHNLKSNYNLAYLKTKAEPKEASKYYKKALDQWPAAQTIVNRAIIENNQREYYQALFTLQEGASLVKDNSYLLNNLAQQFEKVMVIDSADFYYQKAGLGNGQVRNNRLGFAAKYRKPLGADSSKLFKNLDRAGVANASAHDYFNGIADIKNANHMFDMVYLNNWLLSNEVGIEDLQRTRAIIDSTTVSEYQDQLKYNWSLAAFKLGKVSEAIEVFSDLAYRSQTWSDQSKLALGKMYLNLGSYEQAIDLLNDAMQGNFNLELAVAYLEFGEPEKAQDFWETAAVSKLEFIEEIGDEILQAVYSDQPQLESERLKYLYGKYQRYFIDESAENEILGSISDTKLRVNLALELAEHYHRFDNDDAANLMLKNISELPLEMEDYRRYLLLNARINTNDENVQVQLAEFDSLFQFSDSEYLLELALNYYAGMELDSVDYLAMAQDNPFETEAVLIAISHFKNDPDPFRAYSYLAKAVQLNPESPRLMKEYILMSLEVGLDQFAENALGEYGQRFSGQSYLLLKVLYDKKVEEMNSKLELELNEQ